ncbi:hypothetical protein PIB30_047741 [Stylosanthes scabra]|uniref:Defensin-like protein n=1 Tax=Stylosanthes scabra TaxID=79078 RepID=A0ABU6YIK0_9FABA|nr:hypothetical protein [Stylosanthes scabra]
MATNNAASKFLFCILYVALLFIISDARSDSKVTLILSCDGTQNCVDKYCSTFCILNKHFQSGGCIPNKGCCCANYNATSETTSGRVASLGSGIKDCSMGQGKCPDNEACNNDCIARNYQSGHCIDGSGCCCFDA